MNEGLSQMLEAIKQAFIQIRYRWTLFCQLYDSGPESIALMNKSGSNLFELIQKLFIDDAMISLCRLTDPPRTGKYENASINNYIETLSGTGVDCQNLKPLLSALDQSMEPIRYARQKAIAHSDPTYALKVEPLHRITYDNIEKSMETLNEILNLLTGTSSDYTPIIPSGSGGDKLISVLGRAHRNDR